jgi:hypothetical protein
MAGAGLASIPMAPDGQANGELCEKTGRPATGHAAYADRTPHGRIPAVRSPSFAAGRVQMSRNRDAEHHDARGSESAIVDPHRVDLDYDE